MFTTRPYATMYIVMVCYTPVLSIKYKSLIHLFVFGCSGPYTTYYVSWYDTHYVDQHGLLVAILLGLMYT